MKHIKILEQFITEAKKFKAGNKWSKDFDYQGMLAAGLKVNVNTPIKELNKLYDSFEDVNYHTIAKGLGIAIDWIEDNDKKGAEDYMDQFHKAVQDELKVNESFFTGHVDQIAQEKFKKDWDQLSKSEKKWVSDEVRKKTESVNEVSERVPAPSGGLLDVEDMVGHRWTDFQKNYKKLNPKYTIAHDKAKGIYYGFKKGTNVAHWKYFDDKGELFVDNKMTARKVMMGKANKDIFESVNEASRSKVYKAAKKGSYPVTLVVISNGMVVKQELVGTPEIVPAAFNTLQKEYPTAIISIESKTGATLFSESVNESKALKLNVEVPIRAPELKRFIHNYLRLNKKYSINRMPSYSMTFGENKWKKETHWKYDDMDKILYVHDANIADLLIKGGAPSDLFESNLNEVTLKKGDVLKFKTGSKWKVVGPHGDGYRFRIDDKRGLSW